MELVLNLIWVFLAGSVLLAWTIASRNSDSTSLPGYSRRLLILCCVLFVLFPVISISDDVAQTPALTEDGTFKDVLKETKSADSIHILQAVTLAENLILIPSFALWREGLQDQDSPRRLFLHCPNIENRPPPQLFLI